MKNIAVPTLVILFALILFFYLFLQGGFSTKNETSMSSEVSRGSAYPRLESARKGSLAGRISEEGEGNPTLQENAKSAKIGERAEFKSLLEAVQNRKGHGNWKFQLFESGADKVQLSGGGLKVDPQNTRGDLLEIAHALSPFVSPVADIVEELDEPTESDVLAVYRVGFAYEGNKIKGAQIIMMLKKESNEISMIEYDRVPVSSPENKIKLTSENIRWILTENYGDRLVDLRTDDQPSVLVSSKSRSVYVWTSTIRLKNPTDSLAVSINAETGVTERSYSLIIKENTKKR